MVKKFRRAAAGLEEQLPSDLRPPAVLRQTCDYLFNDVISNAPSLAHVHHFVWDRTRAIRNDFSIQQITRAEDLRIAVECYERIARFHILSLHQLALPERPYSKYDWQQEREQLDRTLLSLMQYYDDNRGRLVLPNEAEFRAYCVIFQLQDPIPDLEDRVQSWPREVIQDTRIQKALDLYMAACNVMDAQGPLKPRANHLIARQDWQRFWTLVASDGVSYLMACVAEIYFNLVRRTVLNALFRTSRASSNLATPDWTMNILCDVLAFNNADDVYSYCEHFGFNFKEREDGEHYLDLSSVRGRTLPEPKAGLAKQTKTFLVEDKRFGRTLSAVINGFSVKMAREEGLADEMEEVSDDGDGMWQQGDPHQEEIERQQNNAMDDGESLFIPESQTSSFPQVPSSAVSTNGANATAANEPSIFAGMAGGSSFGKPSGTAQSSFSFASTRNRAAQSGLNPGMGNAASKFDFLKPSTTTADCTTTTSPGFSFPRNTAPQAAIPTTNDEPTNDESNTKTGVFGTTSGEQSSVFSNMKSPFQSSSLPPFQFSTNSLTKTSNSTENASPNAELSPFSSGFATKHESKSPSLDHSSTDLSFAQPAGAPVATTPSFSTQQQPESKPAQPHFTGSQTSSLPNTNQHQPQSSLGPGTKRPSFSNDTRPKKPSPLSNSFSATDDTNNTPQKAYVEDTHDDQPRTQSSLGKEADILKESPRQTQNSQRSRPERASQDFDNLVTRVADEFYTDPIGGIFKQYVEFHAQQIIKEVQENLKTEKLNAEGR